MTKTFGWILVVLWGTLYVYWLVAAFRAKKTVHRNNTFIMVRMALVIVIVVLFYTTPNFARFENGIHVTGLPLAITGVILCAIGIGTAIFARVYLGRNWGMPMSVKENPELVTSGPYRYVRHPIYSGFLLAMLGTALAFSLTWIIIFIVAGVYFAIAARSEERLMLKQFPEQYPEYMKRTKMLVPFIF